MADPSSISNLKSAISNRRIWLARAIAMAADALQIAVFPYFFEGVLSPVNAVLDVLVMIAMTLLVGWHIAFVPTFIVEQLPFADLAPTWTVAAWLATRRFEKIKGSDVPPNRDDTSRLPRFGK